MCSGSTYSTGSAEVTTEKPAPKKLKARTIVLPAGRKKQVFGNKTAYQIDMEAGDNKVPSFWVVYLGRKYQAETYTIDGGKLKAVTAFADPMHFAGIGSVGSWLETTGELTIRVAPEYALSTLAI